jgi:AcrR family transcriptional regulator
MPRHRDPDLEERTLKAAEALWRRGGEKALTMRAVARAAGTNTPAVYRRFRNRDDLIKGLLQRFAGRARQHLEQGETVEKMAEAYVAYAIKTPNEYFLFYKYADFMAPRKSRGVVRAIRDSRPSFAFTEQLLAKNFGGKPEEHTDTALILWALLHGTAMLLLSRSIPEGHEAAMREACRAGVRAVMAGAQQKK